eukprot:scaffold4501_cov395-Prasinococcus_capsulatus_cf.AAC.17
MGDMIKEISKQANKIKNKVQELDASNKEVELNISDANVQRPTNAGLLSLWTVLCHDSHKQGID